MQQTHRKSVSLTKPQKVHAQIAELSNRPFYSHEDWTLFRTVQTLSQKAGVPPDKLRRLVAKELTDNALDACGSCGVGLLADTGGFFVEDEGAGIPGDPEAIANLFSIRRPLISSKIIRLPARGALGNGLRVVAGAVLVSAGSLVVITGGKRLRLTPKDSGDTAVQWEPDGRTLGTRVEIRLGDRIPGDEAFLQWAKMAIRAAGDAPIYTGNTSPHWYDADAFFELLQAALSRTVRDVIQEFDGCSGVRACKITSQFSGRAANSLSRHEAEELLVAARSVCRRVQPKRLALLGPEALKGYHANKRGVLELGSAGIKAALPYTVETWCQLSHDGQDHINVLVNRTPVAAKVSIRRDEKKTDIAIFGCNLSHAFNVGRKPIRLIVNIQSPYMPITSDGKHPNLKLFLDDLAETLMRAARVCRRKSSSAQGDALTTPTR